MGLQFPRILERSSWARSNLDVWNLRNRERSAGLHARPGAN